MMTRKLRTLTSTEISAKLVEFSRLPEKKQKAILHGAIGNLESNGYCRSKGIPLPETGEELPVRVRNMALAYAMLDHQAFQKYASRRNQKPTFSMR
jgi:hypothetical protein